MAATNIDEIFNSIEKDFVKLSTNAARSAANKAQKKLEKRLTDLLMNIMLHISQNGIDESMHCIN